MSVLYVRNSDGTFSPVCGTGCAATDAQIEQAVENYMAEHPVSGGDVDLTGYIELIPESSYPVSEEMEMVVLDRELTFIAGKTYLVKWNGVQYVCVAYELDDFVMLDGAGYPFSVEVHNDFVEMYALDGSTSVTLAIYEKAKYATEEWVEEKLKEHSGGNVDQTIETVLSLKEVQIGSHKSGAFDSADNKSICTKGYVKPFVVSAKVVSADYHLAVVVYDNGAYVRTNSWITVDNTYTFDHENYQYKLYIKRPDGDYIWDFDGCRKSIILTISTADILESYNALETDSETERRNTRNAVQYMMRRNYDISYANAPAPLDLITYAGNNQIVHPKVLYFPNKFGRHKFWLAYNPYPLANAYYENPCVAYSDDGYEWTNIPGNPLDDPGEYGENTDVHLVYVEAKNRLEIWWRYVDNKDDTVEVRREIIYRRTSADGLNWTERETVFVNDSGDTVQNLSPCILHDGSKYKVWVVNDTESTVKYYEGMEDVGATESQTISINDADLHPGSYLVNGNIQESGYYKYTDKIKLSASKTFSLTGKNTNGVPYHIPIRYIVAFDADGNRLSDYSRNTETGGDTISSMPTRQIAMNEAVDSVVLTLYKPEMYTEKTIILEGVDGGTSELSFVRDIPLAFPDDGTGHRLWHIDVIEDNGKTVMLPMCRARDSSVAIEQTWSLFLCTSEDNVTYTEPVQTIVGNPYGWDKQIYRSSIVNVDGEYRIYYTAQDERQRHGIGVSTSNTLSNFVGKW